MQVKVNTANSKKLARGRVIKEMTKKKKGGERERGSRQTGWCQALGQLHARGNHLHNPASE